MLRQASLHFRRALHTCAGTPERAVTTLIGANAAIYCGWQLPNERFQKNVMVRHFLLTPANINSGRLHTTITSAFSHTDTTHLLSNMLALYFFGSRVASAIGPVRLLGVYLFGGFAGGVAHLYNAPGRRRSIVTQPSSKKRYWDIVPFSARPALGASGSVNGLIAIYALLFPFETVRLLAHLHWHHYSCLQAFIVRFELRFTWRRFT